MPGEKKEIYIGAIALCETISKYKLQQVIKQLGFRGGGKVFQASKNFRLKSDHDST